jgi:predicted  nucleic acid-binding Zn-ribbon protein
MAGNSTGASDQAAVAPSGRTSDLILIEVAKLQSDGEYLKRDLGEVRADIREIRSELKDMRSEFRSENSDLRDRMTRLEERVAHLPGKGFIVAVVSTALVLVGGFTTVAPRLQSVSSPSGIQQPAPR